MFPSASLTVFVRRLAALAYTRVLVCVCMCVCLSLTSPLFFLLPTLSSLRCRVSASLTASSEVLK
ncbi:hypothetical protein ABB37_05827 [Leptomonas pyrrhocoris]|uniref:Transmembrane protein n=1 Tax=Leptomonas pyrrhocoris TaxID=157538 RepID=A0A0M9FYF5_LEPPY|nr:hypothetical protein ABB37_05827 [Leptomonas pyrrhocoris]KPA78690.1 hypothetical protein ABB37_05827 [Leptomonas pyrrhocoris]|eukprot:XP_015657129.1 hypothetical protein ABB37_05827 [Leptomonas pyrrhocoris]